MTVYFHASATAECKRRVATIMVSTVSWRYIRQFMYTSILRSRIWFLSGGWPWLGWCTLDYKLSWWFKNNNCSVVRLNNTCMYVCWLYVTISHLKDVPWRSVKGTHTQFPMCTFNTWETIRILDMGTGYGLCIVVRSCTCASKSYEYHNHLDIIISVVFFFQETGSAFLQSK